MGQADRHHLVGALHLHHAVLPRMATRNKGRIVNIASDAARVGSSGAYGLPDGEAGHGPRAF
ncbi:MAG TPA: SDR family NAD(P)-dependent oxidoreductase [Tahibacter sp.]|jgi:NADP-dependent 3-hydroxy acid dehydrogenase YdfG|nr:SDR family NAD(P)-dependent oxidoreductase [Tahibacter sp.]